MMKLLLTLFGVLAVFLLGSVQAEEGKTLPKKTDFLKLLDKNADGKVSKAEFFAALEKKFAGLDVDKSEAVSVEELKLYGEKDPQALQKAQETALADAPVSVWNEEAFVKQFTARGEKAFAALDKNHDLQLTGGELTAAKKSSAKELKDKMSAEEQNLPQEDFIALFKEYAESEFFRLDRNYDGELDNEEMGIPKAKLKAKLAPPVKTPDVSTLEEKQAREKQRLVKSFFAGIDANNDGQISETEKSAAFTRLFNRLDINHDGFVTPDEIIAGRQHPAP
jgi:Ca2+-binding EF-hand superfamily protein